MRRLSFGNAQVSRGSVTDALTGSNEGPLRGLLSGVLALIIALFVTGLVMLALGADPIEAFDGMINGSVGSRPAFAQTLLATAPLILTGLAAAIPFSARIFNVGGEGQLVAGAVGATAMGFWFSSLAAPALVVLAIVGGIVGGAIWGLIAGALRAFFQANEVIVTLMLNFIALLVADYAINSSWADPVSPQTRPLPGGVDLPIIWSDTLVNLGIVLAVVAAIVGFFLMRRTPLGFGITATGYNPAAARIKGYEIGMVTLAVLAIGGAFAGLAGAVEVLGKHHALVPNLSSTYGYTGIAVALVARLNPLWLIPSAFFFAAINAGSNTLQATAGVSTAASLVVQAVFVLSLLALRVIRISYPEVR
jgi:simple sugar transport system permease protein